LRDLFPSPSTFPLLYMISWPHKWVFISLELLPEGTKHFVHRTSFIFTTIILLLNIYQTNIISIIACDFLRMHSTGMSNSLWIFLKSINLSLNSFSFSFLVLVSGSTMLSL
jgi:hypothetical protein